jgi:hypothetical protein
MSGDRGLISGDQYLRGLLVFVYQAIRKRLLLMVAATLVVAAIAYFATPRPSPIFTLQTSIQKGKVAGVALLDLQNTVARINAASFRRRLLQLLNLPITVRAGRLIFDSLTARAETSDTIGVSVRSPDEERGRQALDLVVKELNDEQQELGKSLLADINGRIAETDANIGSLSKIQQSLEEALSNMTKAPVAGDAPDAQPRDLRGVWLLDAISRNEQALIATKGARRELAARLEKLNTYPAAIVDDVVVSSAPMSPRRSRIAFLAGLFTFLGAVVLTVVSRRREMPV